MEIHFEPIDLFLISPLVALFLASVFPLTIKVLRGNRELNTVAVVVYALIGIVAAAGLTIANQGLEKLAFQKALVFDGVSTWATLIILFITALSLLLSRESRSAATHQFSEYVFLVMNAAIGMIMLTLSNDLIVTFISIELMSLCLYILIAMSAEPRVSKEAAFKYFILGSFASAFFLYGAAFVYGTVGSTYLGDIAQAGKVLYTTSYLFIVGVVLMVVGLCFKVSLVPFHAWTPDVYDGAPTPITGFMATGVKVATFMAFLRVLTTQVLFGEDALSLVNAMEWLAVLTIVFGNVAAVMQRNLKRMLAYSSIAHSGYAMVGLVAASVGGQSELGAIGLGFYVFSYSVMTIGAFGVISLFEKQAESVVFVDDLKGLAKRSPWVAAGIAIFMLSLAGIPPTVGFFGKFFLFSAAIKQGFFWLAIWGVLGSAVSVYYYLRPIVAMYMSDEEGLEVLSGHQMAKSAVGLSAVLVLVFGFVVNPFYDYVKQAVAGLFS